MEETTKQYESQSSVELSTNAKGVTQITVKVYNQYPSVARDSAIAIYEELLKKYPREVIEKKG